jgi:zinc transport system substrate-binding protein
VAVALGLAGVGLAGCEAEDVVVAEGPPRVVVSVAPLAGLIEPMLPEGSTVTVIVGPGQSEHGFELTPSQVAAVRQAHLVAVVGLGLDVQVEQALGRRSGRQVVRFADVVGIEGEPHEDEHDHEGHDHGHHDHGGVDPHLWLDPSLAREFVIGVAAALESALGAADAATEAGESAGEDAMSLRRASEELVRRIDEVDEQYRERLAPFAGVSIVTTHDAFGRLLERYVLSVGAVIQPVGAQEPTMASVSAAADAVRRAGARAVFVEPQAPEGWARRLAAGAGVPVGTLDPLGDGDWFAMMEGNLEELVRALEAGGDS